jgi:hypothetical protein
MGSTVLLPQGRKEYIWSYDTHGELDAVVHCKDKIPKFLNKYSQKRNIGASVPIYTFICL